MKSTMSLKSVLLDFQIESKFVQNADDIQKISERLIDVFNRFPEVGNLRAIFSKTFNEFTLFLLSNDTDNVVNVSIYTNGLITITGENSFNHLDFSLISEKMKCEFGLSKYQLLPVHRGSFIKYFPTSDFRMCEYDVDDVVFEELSKFQLVQIVHSKSFGNILILDGLQNIAESDLIYTETLMRRTKEDYKNKEILILGGGDGALLFELLKEDPKFVTMVEIDDVVLKCCNKFMKSICGNVLEQDTGDNYKIIVDDCFKVIDKYIEDGKKFDFVFGDLTDIPINVTSDNIECWDFIMKILKKSLNVLRPTGKYLTHGSGVCNKETLSLFERELEEKVPEIVFEKNEAYVPSFMEGWIFYQIMFRNY